MVLCLTGPMAAGKNAAATILEKRGFATIDADAVVHRIIEEKQKEIAAAFGTTDRKALGALLFAHPELLKKQEDILYPAVTAELDAFIVAHQDVPVALNVTLLYKVPLIKSVDAVLFVDAPRIIRFFRIKKRNHLTSSEIFARFKAQKKIFSHYSAASADIFRVWNVGSLAKLEENIDLFLTQWEAKG
jgi:dephospho-CoA kinase